MSIGRKGKGEDDSERGIDDEIIQETGGKLLQIRNERDLRQTGVSKSILIRVIWNASSQQPKPGLSLLASIVTWEAHRGDPQQGSIQRPKHITCT
jgi:hypothetical protein